PTARTHFAQVVQCSGSRFSQNFLQGVEISFTQRLIPAQLVNHGFVLMRFEELLRLFAEAFYVMSGGESRQIDFSLLANQVRKVGVNILTLRLVDELDETPEPFADIFQH